jgi:hypothetical protein
MDVSFLIWRRKQIVGKRINICILVFESTQLFIDCFIWYCVTCVVYMGWCVRVAQWDRSLDLTSHTCLSPILSGFAPSFVNYKRVHSSRSASDKVYKLLTQGRWFSPGTPDSSITKTCRHDIALILLKVALNTKNSNSNSNYMRWIKCNTICLKEKA